MVLLSGRSRVRIASGTEYRGESVMVHRFFVAAERENAPRKIGAEDFKRKFFRAFFQILKSEYLQKNSLKGNIHWQILRYLKKPLENLRMKFIQTGYDGTCQTGREDAMNTILESLEETAERYPEAPAVTDPSGSRTYRQLVEDARRAGSFLIGHGTKAGGPVVIALEKSCDAVTLLYAVLYAGTFYVFIDLRQPPARVKKLLDRDSAFGADRASFSGKDAPGGRL